MQGVRKQIILCGWPTLALQKKESVKIACMPYLSDQKIIISELPCIIEQVFFNFIVVLYGSKVWVHSETT